MYRKVLLVGVGVCFFVRSALWFFLPLPMVMVDGGCVSSKSSNDEIFWPLRPGQSQLTPAPLMQQPSKNDPDCCCFCPEKLYVNNDPPEFDKRIEIRRWLCCVKGFHADCWQKETLSNGGSLEDHAKLQRSHRCPLCNAHTASF
jgi:hypothetical protein